MLSKLSLEQSQIWGERIASGMLGCTNLKLGGVVTQWDLAVNSKVD